MAKSRGAVQRTSSAQAAFCPSEESAKHGFITRTETRGLLIRVHEVHHLDNRMVRIVTHFGTGEAHTNLLFEGLIAIENQAIKSVYRPRSDPGVMFPLEVGAVHELSFDVSAPGEPSFVTHRRFHVTKKLKVRLGPCEYQAFQVDEKGWNASDPYGPADMGAHFYSPTLKLVVAKKMGRHGNVTAPRTLAPLSDLVDSIARLRADHRKDMSAKGYTD